MRNRILKTLEAYLLTNEDVLEEDYIKDLKEQIEAVKNYKENFFVRLFKKLRRCGK